MRSLHGFDGSFDNVKDNITGSISEERKTLPVGIEDFGEFSAENFYYVDKTMFIEELLLNRGKVNLFTRPRRFGKTLNMSMLKCFFVFCCNPALFNGL